MQTEEPEQPTVIEGKNRDIFTTIRMPRFPRVTTSHTENKFFQYNSKKYEKIHLREKLRIPGFASYTFSDWPGTKL